MNGSLLSPGLVRFQYFLSQVQIILEKASNAENPALTAYTSDLRTPAFMLEGLSRVYKKIYPHQKLKKLNKLFKQLEDLLGQIDYYDSFAKELEQNEKIPPVLISYLKKQSAEKISELNDIFEKEKWTGKKQKQLSEISDILEKINWHDEREDADDVLSVYEKAIEKLIKKYKTEEYRFTDLEADVHELRRQLRWLSIYPQAFRGLMQLEASNDFPDYLKKYHTSEILQSRYNVMPDGSGLPVHIFFRAEYYYGLSWIIAELGKLKDSGLTIMVLNEAIHSVYKTHQNTSSLVLGMLEKSQLQIPDIIKESQQISDTFFKEDILANLVLGEK